MKQGTSCTFVLHTHLCAVRRAPAPPAHLQLLALVALLLLATDLDLCGIGNFRVQQLRLYVGATALGSEAVRWIRAPLASTISEAPRWKLLGVEKLGEDACLDYALEDE